MLRKAPILAPLVPPLLLIVLVCFDSLPAYSQVSLRRKIGQMIMVTVTGDSTEKTTPSMDVLRGDCADGLIGGLVMFVWSENLKSPGQIAHLTQTIQRLTTTPLFLAIDQEGGRVARLNGANGFTSTPTAYELGSVTNTEANTRSVARLMAGWFGQTGLNMNLAPVVDVNVNPSSPAIGALGRSYSATPGVVGAHAGWFIDEFRSKGIVTVLKHFPGHGSAVGDSHLGFTDITNTWSPTELVPYSTLLSGGGVEVVMVGHLYNADYDSLHPASLSRSTVEGVLRQQLGYGGVVVSDAMGMRAVTVRYGFTEAINLAVDAGVDLLLYTTNLDSAGGSLARRIVDHLEERVKAGLLSESRIDEAYGRIMALKGKFLTGVQVAMNEVPKSFMLSSYPNPFNASTVIRFEMPQGGTVLMRIFDMLGRRVMERRDGLLEPGRHEIRWDASGLATGTYFCRVEIEGGGRLESRMVKLLLIR